MGMDQKLSKEYENLLLEDNRLDRTHLRRGIINKYTHIIGKIFKMYLDFTNFYLLKFFKAIKNVLNMNSLDLDFQDLIFLGLPLPKK